MTRVRVLPYKMGSRSAKDLAQSLSESLGRRVIRLLPPERSRFRPRDGDIIINWGSGEDRGFQRGTLLNKPSAVNQASDKLACLRKLEAEGVSTLKFTTNPSDVQGWLNDGGHVFVRTLTRANSGRGIVILDDPSEAIPHAPLYTRGEHKDFECRVHVMNGDPFDFQQKRRRNSAEGEEPLEHSPYIWNHDNHYVFCRNSLSMSEGQIEECMEEAILATQVLGLDFAAIDIGYSEDKGAFIFEVNTAPGLQGTTLQNYTQKLREYM